MQRTPSDLQVFKAGFFRALAHPVRIRILEILAARKGCVCGGLVEILPLAQSTISQHLGEVRNAGLIRGEVDGPRVCYCIEPHTLRRLKALVGGI